MSELRDKYKSEIINSLKETGRYANTMQIPKITKVVVNMGVDTAVDKDTFNDVCLSLTTITGQKPQVRKARKSISNFKLRDGMPIGARVTLRGHRMYEFLERFINTTLPRLRDFRGISPTSFDGKGNYSLGLQEQTVFPEIDPDKIKKIQGMDITIVTTCKTDEEARELLALFGMPFAEAS